MVVCIRKKEVAILLGYGGKRLIFFSTWRTFGYEEMNLIGYQVKIKLIKNSVIL